MQLHLVHCVVDLECQRVQWRDGTAPTRLSSREVALLRYLAARAGEIVPRDEVLREAFGYHAQSLSRAVDTAVSRLRGKIERDPAHPRHLITEFGVGYRLSLAVESAPVAEAPTRPAPLLELSGGSVDLEAGLVHRAGAVERLCGGELTLLRELVRANGAIVAPNRLERKVCGEIRCGSTRLRNLVRRLRAKVEADPSDPRHILAIRGHGYQLVVAGGAPEAGMVTALVARIDHDRTEVLWQAAVHQAALCGGYPAALGPGQACLVFGPGSAADQAAAALTRVGASVGVATGPVRRVENPLTGRFDYLGTAVGIAERRAQRSQPVFAHQAAERVAAA